MFQCFEGTKFQRSISVLARKSVCRVVLVICCIFFAIAFLLPPNYLPHLPNKFTKKVSKKTSANTSVTTNYSAFEITKGFAVYKFSKRETCKHGTHRRLPDCIVIGFGKCGTLALQTMLKLHPNVAVRDWQPIEVNYFSLHYDKGSEWYREAMPCSTNNQFIIEKNPSYVTLPGVAEKVRKDLPNVKLLVIVREPVQRTVSLFLEIGRLKKLTFARFMQTYADEAKYVTYIEKWLEIFPREQLHIVSGDNLIKNPLSELRRVETFLNLDHLIPEDAFVYRKDKGFYCFHEKTFSRNVTCLGSTKGRKHPKVAKDLEKSLKQNFQPYNEWLYKIANRSFHW